MTRVILFLSALLAQLFCTAQTITIKGLIVDSADQKPLSGVTVRISEKESTILASGVTDQRGAFSIALTNKLPEKLKLSHASYEELEIVLPSNNGSALDLGTIQLVPRIQSLAAIVVDGRKAPSSFKIDRQVYQASQFGNAANGTGTDVLRNLPSVSVNAPGEIAFRGSGSFLLLLNGKPLN